MPWIKLKLTTLDRLAAISIVESGEFEPGEEWRPVPKEPDAARILLPVAVFLAVSGVAARNKISLDAAVNKMVDRYNQGNDPTHGAN